MIIGIIGTGVVGTAILQSFKKNDIYVITYDIKYHKKEHLIYCINKSDIIFLCLPTLYDPTRKEYNKDAIYETCQKLVKNNYKNTVVLKSTVEPGTTEQLYKKYKLNIIHNPEFLTAKSAYEDFHNQKKCYLGVPHESVNDSCELVGNFYTKYYPNTEIIKCKSFESELTKIACNTFYAVKIAFFTEIYLLCKKYNSSYDTIKEYMIGNEWINPMHTCVPGHDGKVGFGGMCFPKDVSALNSFLSKNELNHSIIEACMNENRSLRDDLHDGLTDDLNYK